MREFISCWFFLFRCCLSNFTQFVMYLFLWKQKHCSNSSLHFLLSNKRYLSYKTYEFFLDSLRTYIHIWHSTIPTFKDTYSQYFSLNPTLYIRNSKQTQSEVKKLFSNVNYISMKEPSPDPLLQADGISGLQKGLLPALSYQVVMNGMRFGLYRRILDSGIISHADGSVSTLGCIAAGAFVGVVGGVVGSPFYLVSNR